MARRKQSNAAFSLFAFQDIITSVTGIMILVTLILALELTEQVEARSGLSKNIMEDIEETVEAARDLAKKADENQKLIDELKKSMKAGQERISGLAGVDPTSIKSELGNSLQVNSNLEGEIEVLDKNLAQVIQDLDYVQKQVDNSTDKDDAEKLQVRIVALNEQLQEMKASNRRIYHPTEGDAKKPWLVEISKGSIRVAETGVDSTSLDFGSITEFEQWLGGNNPQQVYLVILLKPSGIDEFLGVRNTIKAKGFDRGYDLLSEDQTALDGSH